ncbi:MAG: SdrD B-like domain-containing protein, partial [Bacteroidota bacterium]
PAGAAGTETFTVTGLTSDGTTDIDVTATFAATTSCTGTLPNAYSAPADCSPTCEITVNSAVPSDCDPPTNSYTLAVSVTYSVAPAGEDIVITLNGGASQSFTPSGTDETETFTLTGLTSDGTAGIDVTAAFATTTNCSNTNLNAYDAPADCSPLFSIGSTVFEDGNNNGLLDPTEAGIPNVELQIYAVVGDKDDAINGETDDLLQEVGSDGDLSTPTDNLPYLTDASGNYFFSELAEGSYYVVIPTSNFSGSLSELPISSTDIATSDADNRTDGDDNGLQPDGLGGVVCSPVIELAEGEEPANGTGPNDESGPGAGQDNVGFLEDTNGDMTVDFGFFRPLSIGSTVFVDENDNATQDTGEDGIPGVEIQVYAVVGAKDDATNGETDDVLLDVGSDGDALTPTDSAPLVTDSEGDYLVTGLIPGEYYLVIPATDFGDAAALADTPISSTDIGSSAGDNQTDGDDNGLQPDGLGTVVCSPVIDLQAGEEPTNDDPTNPENGQGNDQDDASPLVDENGDMTVDFGFFSPLSIGSTVFEDEENNGEQDGTDPGIPLVPLELYTVVGNKDDAGNGETDDILVDIGADGDARTDGDAGTTYLTDENGEYLFTGLIPGEYYVVIPATAFDQGEVLEVINVSSDDIATSDSDNGVDGDDNGLQPDGPSTVICSPVVELTPGGEPVTGGGSGQEGGSGGDLDDDDPLVDENGDMTVDFGLFAPVCVGDTAFVDLDMDGTQSDGDTPLAGVTVTLYDSETMQPYAGTDVNGDPVEDAVTDPTGAYKFSELPPGDYYVVFDIGTAPNPELYDFTTPNVGSDTDDSDATPTAATDNTAPSGGTGFIPSGGENLTLDAGVACVIEVEVADPFSICSTQPINLLEDASVTPAYLSGFWTTPDGTGTFLDAGGNELTAPFELGIAATYITSQEDALRGTLTLVLTSGDPGDLAPPSDCPPVSNSVTIEVLKVDCGNFFWSGSND